MKFNTRLIPIAWAGLFITGGIEAQALPRNIGTGEQPMAVAVNEKTNKAYVINHDDNSLTVIDGKSLKVLSTIKTGVGPEVVAVNPITNRIYIGNATEGTVTVVDGATNEVA